MLPLDDLKGTAFEFVEILSELLENADINMVEKTSNETDTTSDLRPIDNFMLINHQKDINIDDANPTKDNFRV